MKKTFIFLLTALLAVSLTACRTSDETSDVSADNSVSVVSELSESSHELSDNSQSSEQVSDALSSAQTSEDLSRPSDQSQPSKTDTSSSDNRASVLISKLVDTDKLGEQTKQSVIDVLEGDNVYMNVSGKIVVFGTMTSNFNVEIAKSDDNTLESITLGNQKMKFITNENGTYTVDDENKTATLTAPAKSEETSEETSENPSESSAETSDGDNYTSNAFANQIISYFASSFGLNAMEFKGNGTEEYEGNEYSFDEYTSENTDIKVYFDNGSPKYIVSTDQQSKQSVITFNGLSSSPDSTLFDIPADYTLN